MKIKVKHLTKHAGRIVMVNSPHILTAAGVVGVASTGFLAWKAGRKHLEIVNQAESDAQFRVNTGIAPDDAPVVLTPAEEFAKVWTIYIPVAISGTATIVSIVCANRIQARRLAAMTAAYAVLSGDFDEYKEKALEKLGQKKAKELNDEVATEKFNKNAPPTDSRILALDTSQSWFQEQTCGQNFISDRQKVEKARNDLNYYLMQQGYADLNEWYALLGLEATSLGSQVGWQAETQVEVVFTPVFMPDGSAATAIRPHPEPKPDFDSLH